MTPNRLQHAKLIFDAALEREPSERAAYLAEACAGDEALRGEVESLLGWLAQGQQCFEAPAIEAVARAQAREPPADLTGVSLSHYVLIEKIGEGGMGIVYKARDTHLDRVVALKLLPPESVTDPERRRRFVQEAKAASALNHPNIVVIHDIDTADGVTFIAMEYVKGKTLDRLIHDAGVPLNDALKHAAQIAGGLAAAHRSGIVHRDIKPANIMIAEPGLVKILDFGLAKLTEPAASTRMPRDAAKEPNLDPADPDRTGPVVRELEDTRALEQLTQPGGILGTVAYMSPEQAEGRALDGRSDIFSLGSVLYEMTTGRRAFAGETRVDTLAAIVGQEPEPLSRLAPEAPAELEWVVNRCLQKSPERRFQRMADLKAALEQLEEKCNSSAVPAVVPRRFSRRVRRWTAGACLALAALGLAAWFGLRRPPGGPAPKVRTFTGLPGQELRPSFSPDGKQLAFGWKGENPDNFDIYVQLVDEPTALRLTLNPAPDYNPVWSPDGHYIAFLRDTQAGTEILRIRAAGGAVEEELHVSAVRRPWPVCGLSWSPNGRFLAIVDGDAERGLPSVFLLNIETREKHQLTAPPAASWDGLPAFSPDGRSLAFIRGRDRPLGDIHVLRLSDNGQPRGEPRRVTADNVFIHGLDWTADGGGIVFSSTRGGVWALWRVRVSGGEPERLPVGGNNAFWPSVSKKENRLAYSEGVDDWNIWRVAAPGGGATDDPAAAPLRISPSPQIDQDGMFSPDGRAIVWASAHSGSHQIWITNSDGSQPRQLTHFEPLGAAEPRWSPDGAEIAFNGYTRRSRNVNVIRASGGMPRQLTTGGFDEDVFGWSHDGRWVYFGSDRGTGAALWKAPASGGSPVLLAPNGRQPAESLDGRFVYYGGPESSLWMVPMSGGTPVRVARNGWGPVVSPDGKFVCYQGPGGSIWRVPASGGEPALVVKTNPRALWTLATGGIYVRDADAKSGPSMEVFSLAGIRTAALRLPGKPDRYLPYDSGLSVSPDGRWILYMRVDRTEADIMLVDNFR